MTLCPLQAEFSPPGAGGLVDAGGQGREESCFLWGQHAAVPPQGNRVGSPALAPWLGSVLGPC